MIPDNFPEFRTSFLFHTDRPLYNSRPCGRTYCEKNNKTRLTPRKEVLGCNVLIIQSEQTKRAHPVLTGYYPIN